MNTDYYDILLSGIGGSATVTRIVRGVSWTAAELSDGRIGAAMRTAGSTVSRMFPSIEGLRARDAARAVMSWNLEEASEGIAVINAYYNRRERAAALGVAIGRSALAGLDIRGKTLGFVGHLVSPTRISAESLDGAAKYYILEREPKAGDYPDSACEYLLPGCDIVVITGSAAINKTMPRLLELSHGAEVIITGPSTPLCPALLALGIRRLCGLSITDGAGLLAAITESPGSIGRFGDDFVLE